eukprot:5704168-Amphidinium_carterae.1
MELNCLKNGKLKKGEKCCKCEKKNPSSRNRKRWTCNELWWDGIDSLKALVGKRAITSACMKIVSCIALSSLASAALEAHQQRSKDSCIRK